MEKKVVLRTSASHFIPLEAPTDTIIKISVGESVEITREKVGVVLSRFKSIRQNFIKKLRSGYITR